MFNNESLCFTLSFIVNNLQWSFKAKISQAYTFSAFLKHPVQYLPHWNVNLRIESHVGSSMGHSIFSSSQTGSLIWNTVKQNKILVIWENERKGWAKTRQMNLKLNFNDMIAKRLDTIWSKVCLLPPQIIWNGNYTKKMNLDLFTLVTKDHNANAIQLIVVHIEACIIIIRQQISTSGRNWILKFSIELKPQFKC